MFGEACWCDDAHHVQGHRQALDEKLATSDIQLFGRPSGLPGSRRLDGHAEDAAGVQLLDELDADTEASDAEDKEDDEAGMDQGSNLPYLAFDFMRAKPGYMREDMQSCCGAVEPAVRRLSALETVYYTLGRLELADGNLFVSTDAEESEEEEESDGEGGAEPRQAPQESLVVEGGRTRRRALFASDATPGREPGAGPCS